MKKVLFISITILIISLFSTTFLSAGTLSLGGQGRYIVWDSGIAKMNTDIMERQLIKEFDQATSAFPIAMPDYTLDIGAPEISGFIYGPKIGYETDDKKWNFGADIFWFGTYSAKVTTTVDISLPTIPAPLLPALPFPTSAAGTGVTIPINTDLAIEQKNIDLHASRKIMPDLSILGGIRYQYYKSEINSDYDIAIPGSPIDFSANIDMLMESYMILPYFGIGYKKNLTEKFNAGINLAAGIPVAGKAKQHLLISSSFLSEDIDLSNNDGKPTMAYFLLGDINLTYMLVEKVRLNCYFKYERMTVKFEELDMDADGNANESASETDVTYGLNFSAEYLISI